MAEKKKSKKSRGGCLLKLMLFILVLIIAAVVAVSLLFPAERIRAEIVKRAEATLSRHVELDAVSLSLLPRLSLDLKGLRIYNPENFPAEEMISIDRLACGLKLGPLLRRQFSFDHIAVDRPVLRLRKTRDGRTNFSFAVKTAGLPVTTPEKKDKVPSEQAALAGFAFDWFEIKGGDLIYADDSSEITVTLGNFRLEARLQLQPDGKKGKSVGTLKIPSVKASLLPENIPLNVEISYNAEVDFQHADLVLDQTRLVVNGVPFNVQATVRNFMNLQSVFARLEASGVDLAPFVDYLPAGAGVDRQQLRLEGKLDGQIEARLEFAGQRTPYIGGKLDLNDLTVGYINIANRAHFDNFHLEFSLDSVSFKSTGGRLSEQLFSLSGQLRNWKDLQFAIDVKGAYTLAGILPLLDSKYGHNLSGLLRFDIQVNGRKSNWVNSSLGGWAAVEKLYYDNDSLTSPLERLDMHLTFSRKEIVLDSFYVQYPGVRATMTGRLKNGLAHLLEPRRGHKKPYLDFQMHAPMVDYDILVPYEEKPPVMAPAPIFLPDIEAGGRVRVDTLDYYGIEFTDITGEVAYTNGVLTYRKVKGQLYSGSVASDGEVNITNMYVPAVKAEFTGTGIEANDFMARFAGLDGHLFGKLNVNGSLSGRGSEPAEFIRSMSADGNLSLQEGKVINFDIINNLSGMFGFKTFQEESLRNLASGVKIRDGRLVLDNTRLATRIGDWTLNGTVAFVEQTLDLDVGLYLSEDYSKNINLLGGLLQDNQGRVRLNFDLTGTYKNPSVSNLSTDNQVVKDKAKDALKNEAEKLWQNLLKKK